MNPNDNEVILLMMVEDLEKRIKLLEKKNNEINKINNVLFEIIRNQKEKEYGNL